MRQILLLQVKRVLPLLLVYLNGFSQNLLTITDCNLNGLTKDQKGNSRVSFTNGPLAAPLGKGSLHLVSPDAKGTVARIRIGQYSNLPLSAITDLSFSTFIEHRSSSVNPYSDAPFVVLQVDSDGDNIAEWHLVFDPSSQTKPFVNSSFPDQGETVVGEWQHWDMFHGGWFDGAADPQHGFPLFSLASFIAQHPTARILNDATQGGAAIRLSGGGPVSSGNFVGDIDNFRIGVNGVTTVYDFEYTTANAGPDKSVIYGYGSNCTTLVGSAAGGVAPYTYSWSPAASAQNSSSMTVCPTDTTTYTFTVTDKNGCTRTDDVVVNVLDVRCGSKMDKVQVCHNGLQICVAKESVAAHLGHGDALGSCQETTMTTKSNTLFGEIVTGENRLILSTFPNPFVASTTIQYTLPADGKVTIKLFDASGKEIASLLNADESAGLHKMVFMRGGIRPGVYYVTISLLSGRYYSQSQRLLNLSR